MAEWKQFVKEGDIIEKGFVTVPDRPGIGLEMNDEAVRKLQRPGATWFALIQESSSVRCCHVGRENVSWTALAAVVDGR